jgi:hypothetical protein
VEVAGWEQVVVVFGGRECGLGRAENREQKAESKKQAEGLYRLLLFDLCSLYF